MTESPNQRATADGGTFQNEKDLLPEQPLH